MAAHMGLGRLTVNRNIYSCQRLGTKLSCLCFVKNYSQETAAVDQSDKIVIPKRIKRDKLSILKALSATDGMNYDAPSPLVIDDPFGIATTYFAKRNNLLSYEQGQQAAQFALSMHSEFVQNRPIEDFTYTPESYKTAMLKEEEDTLLGLEERIRLLKPVEAYNSFSALRDKGESVPDSTVQRLLELLCFCNSEAYDFSHKVVSQYFHRSLQKDFDSRIKKPKKTWQTDSAAEKLFSDLEQPTSDAYNALLRGRAKYNAAKEAIDLYTEMKAKDIRVSREGFNAVLSVAYELAECERCIDFMTDVLKHMESVGEMPSIDTFNNILKVMNQLVTEASNKLVCKFCLQVVAEMNQIGIEPSLATWYYVLKCFYRMDMNARGTSGNRILFEIMDLLKEKEFTLQHPDDNLFFAEAMTVNRVQFRDLPLAYKIHDLMCYKRNANFLGDYTSSQAYHGHFLRIVLRKADFSTFLQLYKKLVKFTYNIDGKLMQMLLREVDVNEAYEHLPFLWSDIERFNLESRDEIVTQILDMFSRLEGKPEITGMYDRITETVLLSCKMLVEQTTFRRREQQFNIEVVSGSMSVCCHLGKYERAKEIFNICNENKHTWVQLPRVEDLVVMGETAIKEQDIETAVKIVTTLSDCSGRDSKRLVKKILQELDPDENQKSQLELLTR